MGDCLSGIQGRLQCEFPGLPFHHSLLVLRAGLVVSLNPYLLYIRYTFFCSSLRLLPSWNFLLYNKDWILQSELLPIILLQPTFELVVIAMDIKKKMLSAKGAVTRATGLIDEQEQLEPAKHTEAAL